MATILVDMKRNERVARQFERLLGMNVYKYIATSLYKNPNNNLRIYNISNHVSNEVNLVEHFDMDIQTQVGYVVYKNTFGGISYHSNYGYENIVLLPSNSAMRDKMFLIIMNKGSDKPYKKYTYVADENTRYNFHGNSILRTHVHNIQEIEVRDGLDKSGYDVSIIREKMRTLVAYRCKRTRDKIQKFVEIEKHIKAVLSEFNMVGNLDDNVTNYNRWGSYYLFKYLTSAILTMNSATKKRRDDTYRKVQQRLNSAKSRVRSQIKWLYRSYDATLTEEQKEHLEKALEI